MNTQTKSISLILSSLAVTCVFAYSVPNTFAQFTTQALSQNNEAAAGTVVVELVDANGNQSSSPIFSIANAQPSMASQTSIIRIANLGSLSTDIHMYAKNIVYSTNNLNDVLNISIKDSQNNSLYSGSISALNINLANVAAGITKELTATITWPDLANVDDNPYQGATFNFELAVDSASVSA